MGNVNEFVVFIASPGDLDPERDAIRGLEQRINGLFADSGLRVRVTRWEQLPPAYSRPQGQINPLVDECDVFIGMLRRRWGTPTGEAATGFVEEFDRALARRTTGGAAPEIAMFFASHTPDELADAGPSLREVLAFKRRFEEDRIGLHDSFDGPADLVQKVQDLITQFLLRALASRDVGPAAIRGPAEVTAAPGSDLDATAGATPDDAQLQVIGVLDAFRSLLGGMTGPMPDTDRLELFATALGRDREPIGTHLVNRLYRRIDELDLVAGEGRAWFRTLLQDIGTHPSAQRVVPGWKLFADDTDVVARLVASASESGPIGVGAVRALSAMRARPIELWPSDDAVETVRAAGDAWAKLLNANPTAQDAIDYLLAGADDPAPRNVQSILVQIIDAPELDAEVRSSLVAVGEALNGSASALVKTILFDRTEHRRWQIVLGRVPCLDAESVNELATRGAYQPARTAAIARGLNEGLLTDAVIAQLVFADRTDIENMLVAAVEKDARIAPRLLQLSATAPAGKTIPHRLRARIMALILTADAIRILIAQSTFDNTAWAALGFVAGAEPLDEARAVLDDGSAFRASLPDEVDDALARYLVDDRRLIAAALLARSPALDDTDGDRVVRWFASVAASQWISEDVWEVIALLAARRPDLISEAMFAPHAELLGFGNAGKYLDGPLGAFLAPALATSSHDWERELAAAWLARRPERTVDELRQLLYDESQDVRIAAATELTVRSTRKSLEELQRTYPERTGTYWYNVVAFLDATLYQRRIDGFEKAALLE